MKPFYQETCGNLDGYNTMSGLIRFSITSMLEPITKDGTGAPSDCNNALAGKFVMLYARIHFVAALPAGTGKANGGSKLIAPVIHTILLFLAVKLIAL
jgi:hypothetical protein